MSFGRLRIGAAQDARRHVARVVLVIEDLGRLDIGHLLPGRDLDAEMGLDEPVLLAGRLDQVDPQGVGRDRLARRQNGAVEGLALRSGDLAGLWIRIIRVLAPSRPLLFPSPLWGGLGWGYPTHRIGASTPIPTPPHKGEESLMALK